LETVRLIITKM